MIRDRDALFDLATMRRYAQPGQCIESRPFGDRGTIGIIGVDDRTGHKVAVTAMHVMSGVTEYPSPLHPETITFESPCVSGTGPVMGTLLRGTLKGIDAALLDIEGQPVANDLGPIGIVRFWRSVDGADENRPVRMLGAASGSVQHGRIVTPAVPVPSWDLDSAIVVEMSALRGDSGAPLVDHNARLIGILVGGNATRQLFCPIDLVFHRLSCTLFRR